MELSVKDEKRLRFEDELIDAAYQLAIDDILTHALKVESALQEIRGRLRAGHFQRANRTEATQDACVVLSECIKDYSGYIGRVNDVDQFVDDEQLTARFRERVENQLAALNRAMG